MRPREPKLPTFVPDKGFTVEEWLAVEDVTDERYEFHDGKLVSVRAMAGGTYRHAMLMETTTLPAEDVVLPGLGHRLPMAGLYRGFDQAPQG